MKTMVAVAAILSLSFGTAFAQSSTMTPPAATPPAATTSPPPAAPMANPSNAAGGTMAKADKTFADKAAQANAAEVAEAKIALQKSSRQDIKEFAQRMVTDHTKANTQLQQVASQNGLTLPNGPASADQKQAAKLDKMSGASFDKAYIADQKTAHKQAVSLFSKESKDGKNPALKSFAGQTLPTLQDHLKMVNALPKAG